jgi:hypothetical protein
VRLVGLGVRCPGAGPNFATYMVCDYRQVTSQSLGLSSEDEAIIIFHRIFMMINFDNS